MKGYCNILLNQKKLQVLRIIQKNTVKNPSVNQKRKDLFMKKLLVSSVILLTATLFIAAIPTDAEAKIYEDTLRLHILANSNSEEDQALKLEIRNLLLSKYGARLKNTESIESAIDTAKGLIRDMEGDVSEWLRNYGYDYPVRITLTEEWYDTREYENYTLPRGIYTSLRVIIGSGEGKNWWCVMYPPLCLELACEDAPHDDGIINYSNEEIKLINRGEYNVKFKILELLSDAFAKNS